MEGHLPSPLGLDRFESLGLKISRVSIQNTDLDTLEQEFPSVFDGKLGTYTGKLVSFNLDPTVALIRLNSWHIPLVLKSKVDMKLDKLITQGILKL